MPTTCPRVMLYVQSIANGCQRHVGCFCSYSKSKKQVCGLMLFVHMCPQIHPSQLPDSPQFVSELEPLSTCCPSLPPRECDVPAVSGTPTVPCLPDDPLTGGISPPPPPSPCVHGSLAPPLPPRANMPLHQEPFQNAKPTDDVTVATHLLLACIDICVVMVSMYMTSTESCVAQYARRKKLRRSAEEDESDATPSWLSRRVLEEDTLEHPHARQVIDLLAWQVQELDARWYVKPRSTCWFEEYLFKIYTPDMFYDILRMRRRDDTCM